uniref:Ubiquitin-related modifier 1 homolog n=1 Tax=Acrobeloides nanus TaxID=290746 RepID=A0A914DRY3_9BILA
MKVKLYFSGGSEILFGNIKEHKVILENSSTQWTIKDLLSWISNNLLKDSDRSELLIVNENVRPGILVLVNDVDWEILGGLDAEINDGDVVSFISTLHGG